MILEKGQKPNVKLDPSTGSNSFYSILRDCICLNFFLPSFISLLSFKLECFESLDWDIYLWKLGITFKGSFPGFSSPFLLGSVEGIDSTLAGSCYDGKDSFLFQVLSISLSWFMFILKSSWYAIFPIFNLYLFPWLIEQIFLKISLPFGSYTSSLRRSIIYFSGNFLFAWLLSCPKHRFETRNSKLYWAC